MDESNDTTSIYHCTIKLHGSSALYYCTHIIKKFLFFFKHNMYCNLGVQTMAFTYSYLQLPSPNHLGYTGWCWEKLKFSSSLYLDSLSLRLYLHQLLLAILSRLIWKLHRVWMMEYGVWKVECGGWRASLIWPPQETFVLAMVNRRISPVQSLYFSKLAQQSTCSSQSALEVEHNAVRTFYGQTKGIQPTIKL